MAVKKMKIRKSISKRFRITKGGKVLFRGSHVRHLRRKKNKSQIRRQKISHELGGRLKRKVKKFLGKA